MTIIGFCTGENDQACVSMREPLTAFLNQQVSCEDVPLVSLVGAYDLEGAAVKVFVFNLMAEDMICLNDVEKRFFVDGVNKKFISPVIGISKDSSGLYCAMMLSYHELQMQVATPVLKSVMNELLVAHMDSSPVYVCVRIMIDDSVKADGTGLYRLTLHVKDEDVKNALKQSECYSDESFYQHGCDLADNLTGSDFMVLGGTKNVSMLN